MSDAAGRPRAVLVLGGGSAIGLAIAEALVRRGARLVILAAHHPERMQPAADTLRAAGAEAVEVVAFDAEAYDTHEAVIAEAFARARGSAGDIDVAVLAFGRLDAATVLDETPAEAGHVAAVNLAGAVSSGLAVGQALREQGHGTLVVLSSLSGQRPRPMILPYASAKRGLDAFTDGLADALHGSGVRVLTVRPGWVHSPMTAGRRSIPLAVTPERVARDVLAGLDRGKRVVWSPWSMRYVAWALRIVPRPLFRIMGRSR